MLPCASPPPLEAPTWSRFRHRHVLALTAALATGVLALASCSDSPTEPEPRATVHRTVTAVVTDSLGAPAPNAAVMWVAMFDSAGIAETRFDLSDAEGANLQVLARGHGS